MRKNFYTLLFILLSITLKAQKVDLDRFNFTVSYRELPHKLIDSSYHTFSAQIELGLVTQLTFRNQDLAEMFKIDGWKKLDYDGQILLDTRFDDVIIERNEVKENVEILKDKDGKATGTKSTYYLQITYSFAAQTKITDNKGQYIETINIATRDQKRIYNSESFTSIAEANAYFKFGLIALEGQLTKESVNNSIVNLNNILTYNYGYPIRVAGDYLWILNSRRHPEYESHHRAWLNFQQVITQMSADEPVDGIRQQLQPVIDYFNSVTKKYNSNSKGDRKLRYATYYNLAKIYLYLDDPDDAMAAANELVINGFDPKDGRRLNAAAIDLKMYLKQSKRSSRHFQINTQDYTGIGYLEQ